MNTSPGEFAPLCIKVLKGNSGFCQCAYVLHSEKGIYLIQTSESLSLSVCVCLCVVTNVGDIKTASYSVKSMAV